MAMETARSSERPSSRWRRLSVQDPEERRRILAQLYPELDSRRHWWFRFGVMTGLSVVVATMGLSQDSAAVVIGAMLIAPLMTPVLGIAAGVAMAWPKRLRQSLLGTLAGATGATALAWALTSALPSSEQVLTTQVLQRTSPDLRDLFIGLAAGAAGAYAVSHEDVSAALPGVAVAVALVPPLATTGFTLAIGRPDLAGGALLLFVTNLVAIVVAAIAVLLAGGFVPSGRRARVGTRIRLGTLVMVVALVGVAIPLTGRTFAAASHADTTRKVNQLALSWLAGDPGLKLSSVAIDGSQVTVEVIGATAPPTSTSLVQSLRGVLGPDAAVQVRWFQSGTSAKAPPTPTTVILNADQLRSLVENWLAAVPGGSNGTHIVSIGVNGTSVTVKLAGTVAPPEVSSLATTISKIEGRSVQLSVEWSTPPTMETTTSTVAGR